MSTRQLITIDVLFKVLSRSIFNPFIVWLIPLCLRAVSYPGDHPHVIWTVRYAFLVSWMVVLQVFDHGLGYGKARELDWEEEVVVITGGASGLGKILVEMYGLRGVSVAVLDINCPTKEELLENDALGSENVRWYKCDVSSREDVEKASKQIQQDVG